MHAGFFLKNARNTHTTRVHSHSMCANARSILLLQCKPQTVWFSKYRFFMFLFYHIQNGYGIEKKIYVCFYLYNICSDANHPIYTHFYNLNDV